jgi:translation initiation factor 5B
LKYYPAVFFRATNPCVLGVEVLEGVLQTGMPLMKANGDSVKVVKEIQLKKENIKSAEKGKQVAISIMGITGGRQVNENDVLYTDLSPIDYRKFKKNAKLLSPEEKELLKEIAEIKRKSNPTWGL